MKSSIQLLIVSSLLLCSLTMMGCSGGSERVVGETEEWTIAEYEKARDAEQQNAEQ
jgi:hypothetical protein